MTGRDESPSAPKSSFKGGFLPFFFLAGLLRGEQIMLLFFHSLEKEKLTQKTQKKTLETRNKSGRGALAYGGERKVVLRRRSGSSPPTLRRVLCQPGFGSDLAGGVQARVRERRGREGARDFEKGEGDLDGGKRRR